MKHCLKCGHQRMSTDQGPDTTCSKCGRIYAKVEAAMAAKILQPANQSAAVPVASIAKTSMNTKQLLGLIGSIVLFVGVFTPIVSMPIVGNMNFFQNGEGIGVIVLILAVISFIMVLTKKYHGLLIIGLVNLGVLLGIFSDVHSKIDQAKAKMELQLSGNPFRGLADLAIQSIQIQWGWALLVVGAVLIIASSAMKEELK